jgi:hypothetical protein
VHTHCHAPLSSLLDLSCVRVGLPSWRKAQHAMCANARLPLRLALVLICYRVFCGRPVGCRACVEPLLACLGGRELNA